MESTPSQPTPKSAAAHGYDALHQISRDKDARSLVFDFKTGELLFADKSAVNDQTGIVLDRMYHDGFFSRHHSSVLNQPPLA